RQWCRGCDCSLHFLGRRARTFVLPWLVCTLCFSRFPLLGASEASRRPCWWLPLGGSCSCELSPEVGTFDLWSSERGVAGLGGKVLRWETAAGSFPPLPEPRRSAGGRGATPDPGAVCRGAGRGDGGVRWAAPAIGGEAQRGRARSCSGAGAGAGSGGGMVDSVYRTRSLGVAAEGLPDQYADGRAARVWQLYIGDTRSRTAEYRSWLVALLRQHRCRSVLDVACGTGVDSIMLLEEGFLVTSVDASDKMLKYALKERWERRKEEPFDRWGAGVWEGGRGGMGHPSIHRWCRGKGAGGEGGV
uniref:Glycine N-methyltransferase n=1 Tax=Dromaius novaehollandiae TaxID=8790 RepID=A0A8C4J0B0_DRONO